MSGGTSWERLMVSWNCGIAHQPLVCIVVFLADWHLQYITLRQKCLVGNPDG
jgi:hypothetical protein